MTRRTEVQLALLVMGLIVWGYGQRTENTRLTWFGLGFFAVATLLRFARRKVPIDDVDAPGDSGHEPPSDPHGP